VKKDNKQLLKFDDLMRAVVKVKPAANQKAKKAKARKK
jgi:hypothetical protein